MTTRRLRALLLTLVLVLGACGSGFGKTTVSIEVRFSRSARDPAALARQTEQITLAVTGEGLSAPIETTLAPVEQLIVLEMAPGFKDFIGQAWRGHQLLAEGQAGALLEKGQKVAVILNLVPINDAPGLSSLQAAQMQVMQSLGATGTTSQALPLVQGPAATTGWSDAANAPRLALDVVPGVWPLPYGAQDTGP